MFGFWATAQADFMEDLISMTKDGYRMDDALQELARNFGGRFAVVARTLRSTLSQGRPLADGMQGIFDPILVDATRAGEKGGLLQEAVEAGIQLLRDRSSAVGQLVQALTYPAFIFILVMSLTTFLVVSVFPEFASMVPYRKMTTMGKLVMAIGNFITSYGLFVAVFLGLLVYAVVWSMPNVVGPVRHTLDRVPPWRFYRVYQSSTFLQNLSLLLRSGVGFRDALQLMARNTSPYVAWHVREMSRRLRNPSPSLASGSLNAYALETGMLPHRDVRRLRVLSQSSAFETALFRRGERAAQDMGKLLSVVKTVLTTAVLIICGVFLGIAGLGLSQTIMQVGS